MQMFSLSSSTGQSPAMYFKTGNWILELIAHIGVRLVSSEPLIIPIAPPQIWVEEKKHISTNLSWVILCSVPGLGELRLGSGSFCSQEDWTQRILCVAKQISHISESMYNKKIVCGEENQSVWSVFHANTNLVETIMINSSLQEITLHFLIFYLLLTFLPVLSIYCKKYNYLPSQEEGIWWKKYANTTCVEEMLFHFLGYRRNRIRRTSL